MKSARAIYPPYLLICPAVLLVLLVTLYPILYGFHISLYNTEFLRATRYIGLGNYVQFLRDVQAYRNISNSLVYVIGSLVISLPLGMATALILNHPIRLKAMFRAIIILPWVIAQVVTALLWKWLLDPTYGPVNYYLLAIGIGSVNFLGNPNYAMPTLIMANVWRSFPLATVLLLAALQTIPSSLYEVAGMDGASAWKSFTHITLPLILPTLLITLILMTLQYFNMVTLMFVLTAGGPLGRTETLSLRVFREAFDYWHIGYATTLGIIIFIFNVVFSILYILVLKRESYH